MQSLHFILTRIGTMNLGGKAVLLRRSDFTAEWQLRPTGFREEEVFAPLHLLTHALNRTLSDHDSRDRAFNRL